MEYRELGNTGLQVSALSFGASSLGGVFHAINEEEAIKTVHEAIDKGINFIDVSPYYGFEKSEIVLGKALKEIPRDKYYISTKVGRYGTNGVKSWDYSAKRSFESVKESMQRLNIDYIDLINVHDIEFSDLNQVINETLPALHSVKKSGDARFVGITGLPLEKLKYVIEHVDQGTVDTVLSFCHYCLNDHALVDYLGFFQKHEIGVINAAPLSMGLLTRGGPPAWHPASEAIKAACRKAVEHCNQKGYKIEQLAVKFSVDNPSIASSFVSTANPVNIIENIEWAEAPQNHELLKEVLGILRPIHNETWDNS